MIGLKRLAYVTNTDSNDISVVDLTENTEVGRIPIGGSPRGGMAIDKKGVYGYVSNCAGNTISVIDLANNREVTRVTVGISPRGVALTPDSSLLFVSNSGSADISVIDTSKREEITRIPVGDNPRALSVTPDGKYVNIPCWGADSISVIEINYNNPVGMKENYRLYLGKDAKPYHVFSHYDGKHAYSANTHRHTVSVIDLLDMKVKNEISVGYGPRAVIADPKEPFLYVSCEASNAVSVIDTLQQKEVKQIPVGPTPRGLKIDEAKHVILCSSFSRFLSPDLMHDANSLSVIDLKKKEKIDVIKVGLGPCSINIYDPVHYENQINSNDKEYIKS